MITRCACIALRLNTRFTQVSLTQNAVVSVCAVAEVKDVIDACAVVEALGEAGHTQLYALVLAVRTVVDCVTLVAHWVAVCRPGVTALEAGLAFCKNTYSMKHWMNIITYL